jgi:hypothetical protein
MPLRDHFHPPLRDSDRWEAFHSAWANTFVRHLNAQLLPRRYRAFPQVTLGAFVEADVATFEEDESSSLPPGQGNGAGVATAVWAPARPTQVLGLDFPAQDTFEVQVHDDQRNSRLVAAVELVSPRNKDRLASRRAFAVKCAAYLQQNVSVVVIDVVTERHLSLDAELMQLLEQGEAAGEPHPLSAIAYRTLKEQEAWRLELWRERLTLGGALPTMPLWLASNLALPLDLEAAYEETCQVLRIR